MSTHPGREPVDVGKRHRGELQRSGSLLLLVPVLLLLRVLLRLAHPCALGRPVRQSRTVRATARGKVPPAPLLCMLTAVARTRLLAVAVGSVVWEGIRARLVIGVLCVGAGVVGCRPCLRLLGRLCLIAVAWQMANMSDRGSGCWQRRLVLPTHSCHGRPPGTRLDA